MKVGSRMEKDKEIARLQVELDRQMERNRYLRQRIGAWRRKATNEPAQRYFLREGHSNDGWRYRVYVITEMPADLALDDVLEYIRFEILPSLDGYTYREVNYSTRYNGWLLTVQTEKYVNMFIPTPKEIEEWRKQFN